MPLAFSALSLPITFGAQLLEEAFITTQASNKAKCRNLTLKITVWGKPGQILAILRHLQFICLKQTYSCIVLGYEGPR